MTDDGTTWEIWICLDGLASGRGLEHAASAAGYGVLVTHDAAVPDGLGVARPGVAVVSDAVDGWLRIVGELHRTRPKLRILLVTDLHDHLDLVTALGAGVDGIARHADPPAALLGSISGVRQDGVSLPRALTKDLVGAIRVGRGRTIATASGQIRVTDREWQILQYMLQGLSTREMANEMFVAVGTVRSHVSALLGKLGVRSRSAAVELVGRDPGPTAVAR